jgi:hypothetical protein
LQKMILPANGILGTNGLIVAKKRSAKGADDE